jgi:hypothetical protein
MDSGLAALRSAVVRDLARIATLTPFGTKPGSAAKFALLT